MSELDVELALERAWAVVAPEVAAHDRATLRRALADREPPPPPSVLLEPRWLGLGQAAAVLDAPLAARGRALARWSLAARVALHPAVRAAATAARDLDGLAVRHQALAAAARALGLAEAGALVAALYGAAVGAVTAGPADVVDAAAPLAEAPPPVDALRALLATRAGVDPRPITCHRAPRSLTIVVTPGREVHCLCAEGVDPLATLTLAIHEWGHGLRGCRATTPYPDRVEDEAAAARAVRDLEDAAIVPSAAVRAALRVRRVRRERLTAALAAFEGACLAGVAPATAWTAVAALDPRPPSTHAALFDEPGVMAAYHAADRLAAARG